LSLMPVGIIMFLVNYSCKFILMAVAMERESEFGTATVAGLSLSLKVGNLEI
jgi:hypothetical protein